MTKRFNAAETLSAFSIIPNPRWFVIDDHSSGAAIPAVPDNCASWNLAEHIINDPQKIKIQLSEISLTEWSSRYGALPDGLHQEQGYAIKITGGKIIIGADTKKACINAIHTISQLIVQADRFIPDLHIVDWPDMDTRCAHICYHLAMDWMPESVPNFDSLMELIKKLANFKYNAILLEIESMFPYSTDQAIAASQAFTREQIGKIDKLCSGLGLEIIPLLQCLGHVYNVLRLPEFSDMRETVDTTQQYCPSNPAVVPFYTKLARELTDSFSQIKKFHIGGDESRRLGVCPQCSQTAAGNGKGALYGRHVGKIAEIMDKQGIVPLVWSDMIAHHPEALEYLPTTTEIVYWNYNIANHGTDIDFTAFRDHPVWAAAGVRFETCNHTMYKFKAATRGIAFLAGEAKRMQCRQFLVTDWMKGIPYELSLIGLAYGAEESWFGGRSMDEFSACYTHIVFGAECRHWWKAYSSLEDILPYCEDAQARLNDSLDRYDLSGLSFRERIARYTLTTGRRDVTENMKRSLETAEFAAQVINKLKGHLIRSHHELEMLYLSAETNAHKARLGLAVDEAVCLLKFPIPDGTARCNDLAKVFEDLINEHDALRRKTERLLRKGMMESHSAALLNVKFEPAARGWMKYFRDALRKGLYVPLILGKEIAPEIS